MTDLVPDLEVRRGLAAMRLTDDIGACEALIAGLPVPRKKLVRDVLDTLGESRTGPPFVLTDELALRVDVNGAAAELGAHSSNGSTPALRWQKLADVDMRSIRFVDKPLWQADAFHLLAGRKGQGKGTLLSLLTGQVNRGELGDKRNVVWIGSEDSAAIDIGPRIEAAGGDRSRVLVVASGHVQLPRDVEAIKQAIYDVDQVGMLVIDPVANHTGGKDSNAEEIRAAIQPLNEIADECKCMVFGVRHLTEKEAKQGVLAAILGSSAWVQVPRAVIAIARDDDDPAIGHAQCVAGNRLPPETPGRMFRLEGVKVDGLENEVTRATWIGDSTKNVEAMLAATNSVREPSKSAAARELILDILEQDNEQESETLDARVVKATGLAAKTVRNIRFELGDAGLVKARPERDEDGKVYRWLVRRTAAPRDLAS